MFAQANAGNETMPATETKYPPFTGVDASKLLTYKFTRWLVHAGKSVTPGDLITLTDKCVKANGRLHELTKQQTGLWSNLAMIALNIRHWI